MNRDLHYLTNYSEFFNFLLKWKVVESSTVYNELFSHLKKTSYWNMVSLFKKEGLIETVGIGYPKKSMIRISSRLARSVYKDSKLGFDLSEIIHESLLTDYCLFFLNNLKVGNIELAHELLDSETGNSKLMPDAVIFTNSNKKIAIELELTQKSRTRIYRKFNNYMHSEYDYFIYLFINRSMSKNYVNRAREFNIENNEEKGTSFLDKLIYIEHLTDSKDNLSNDLKFIIKGKECDFSSFAKVVC
ncbi:hypothetical protein A9Q84_00245 [Halobacteriovorax marinus]|uniref:Uncharacterized protein n=1 Tax=Halobacteriovorax marinus TaxID=97084 RepID=A0A1Y5FDH2_9BACT|nr:hypothetical protein A9Q84_00245 [Halobacteriovorax marinus]